jgi:hypothetical protein
MLAMSAVAPLTCCVATGEGPTARGFFIQRQGRMSGASLTGLADLSTVLVRASRHDGFAFCASEGLQLKWFPVLRVGATTDHCHGAPAKQTPQSVIDPERSGLWLLRLSHGLSPPKYL